MRPPLSDGIGCPGDSRSLGRSKDSGIEGRCALAGPAFGITQINDVVTDQDSATAGAGAVSARTEK